MDLKKGGHVDSTDEVKSLLSALARGTQHAPSHRINSHLGQALERHDPRLFSPGVRELCSKFLSDSVDLDSMAEEAYRFWTLATRGLEQATKQVRWAFRTDRLCGAGSEIACEFASEAQMAWMRLINPTAIPGK